MAEAFPNRSLTSSPSSMRTQDPGGFASAHRDEPRTLLLTEAHHETDKLRAQGENAKILMTPVTCVLSR